MSKMVGRKPPEAALVSRLWRVSGTNVDVAVAHEMLLALGQATTQSPLKIELDPAERRPEPTPITIEDVARWFGVPPDQIDHLAELREDFRVAREQQENRFREALRIAREWNEACLVGGQNMPQPPLCSGCGKPLAVLGKIQGTSLHGHTTFDKCDGNAIGRILAMLERIPCMSEDCDGPEYHVPDARDGLPNTRCHRCAAVRLAKSVVNS